MRDHDIHLTFTSVVYEAQRRAGRHATTEHPYTCRAWKTRAYNRMRGFDCYVDQCGYGLMLPGDHGQWHPAKKPATFRTTKKSLYDKLWRKCPGCPYHVPIEGSARGFGNRSSMAEDYPQRLAKKLADLMAEEPAEEDGDLIIAFPEVLPPLEDVPMEEEKKPEIGPDEAIILNSRLRSEVGAQAYTTM